MLYSTLGNRYLRCLRVVQHAKVCVQVETLRGDAERAVEHIVQVRKSVEARLKENQVVNVYLHAVDGMCTFRVTHDRLRQLDAFLWSIAKQGCESVCE